MELISLAFKGGGPVLSFDHPGTPFLNKGTYG
jgi:hypothetical protein